MLCTSGIDRQWIFRNTKESRLQYCFNFDKKRDNLKLSLDQVT